VSGGLIACRSTSLVMERKRPGQERLLDTLQGLLEIPAADLPTALVDACNQVARVLDAEKVDAFLHDPTKECMVAIGSSTQPLSALQKKLGLDILPIANGGRVVWVYENNKTFCTGRLDEDPEELRGVKNALKIKSKIGVPINIGGRTRGMVMIASTQPNFFSAEDVQLAETVVQWVGTVVHRAELIRELAENAVEQGRRAVAEELVTVLAHDLRNLLAPISMRLHLIRRRRDEDRAQDASDAESALKTLDRLTKIISELLDVARIDQGLFRLELEPLNLVALTEDVARSLSRPDHTIHVNAANDALVLADANRVRQCLENLLANAVNHSPTGAPVRVFISTEAHDDGERARLEVHDEGPGIPPELLPRIFERFASGARSTGLGLGLYLAQRIAVALDGDLSVESQPGQGAHFTLLLPCYQEERLHPQR
jgi:two-component system, OmpR family, sensor kinase